MQQCWGWTFCPPCCDDVMQAGLCTERLPCCAALSCVPAATAILSPCVNRGSAVCVGVGGGKVRIHFQHAACSDDALSCMRFWLLSTLASGLHVSVSLMHCRMHACESYCCFAPCGVDSIRLVGMTGLVKGDFRPVLWCHHVAHPSLVGGGSGGSQVAC
jgi:hypothetical protein